MADVSNELIYEILKSLQTRMDRMEHGIGEVRHELTSIRLSHMSMQNDIHNIYGIAARTDDRLDRIEHRLELRELAEKSQSSYEPPTP